MTTYAGKTLEARPKRRNRRIRVELADSRLPSIAKSGSDQTGERRNGTFSAGLLAREPGRADGFSLVELMAALLITMFIMAGVYGLMLENQRTYHEQVQFGDAQQAARVGLDLMTREIRMAGSDPSGRAFAPDATCVNVDYNLPVDETAPAEADLAPLTVAEIARLRINMDRPTFVLSPEPTDTPLTGTPTPKEDCDSPGDGLYESDNEDGAGDGFINDDNEDIEYEWRTADNTLYRIEHRKCPNASCDGCAPACDDTGYPIELPLVENVTNLEFKYYDDVPPTTQCPTGTYDTVADYETARDLCDAPLSDPVDPSIVERVRIRLHVQTEKVNIRTFEHDVISMTAEATLRNRVN